MIRRSTAAILLGLVAATAATSWWTVRALRHPKTLMEIKLAEAQRVLYYRMSHDRGPAVRLSGAEDSLRVITHVILPPGTAYDPMRRVTYGIRLRLTAEGREVWQQELYTQSRQSKDQLRDGIWRFENSFVHDPSVQITDDRTFLVHLPPDVPTNAVLTTSLLGDQASVGLVRIYKQERRDAIERQMAMRSLSADRQREEVWSNAYDPWSMLPREEKLSRVRYRTERLSALGERGLDYDIQTVFYTGFRLPREALEQDQALKIHSHRAAVINIVGPTEIAVRVEHAAGSPYVSGDAGATLEIESVHAAGRGGLRPSALGVGETTTVHLPAGLHSVRLSTASAHSLAVWVTGPKSALFGAAADMGDDRGRLHPDKVRIPVLLSGPDRADVILASIDERNPTSRLVRIDTRFLDMSQPHLPARRTQIEHDAHAPSGAGDRFAGTLVVTFVDRDGAAIRTVEQPLRSERAPLEWLERRNLQPIEVSEPVSARLIAPRSARSIRVRTSRPAALRLYRFLPGEVTYEAPYRDAALADHIRWRYGRLDKRVWWPMRPLNHDVLARRDQQATLVAQARLVARSPVTRDRDDEVAAQDPEGSVPATVVEPEGSPERHRIIEPIAPEDRDEARAEWGPGMVAQVPTGRAARYLWPAADQTSDPGRARLHYWVDPGDLGKLATLHIDEEGGERGNGGREELLWGTHGFWELPLLAPGAHALRVTTGATSLQLFIDRPPERADAPLYRLRTVYAMDRQLMRVPVVKPMGGRAVLHVVVYAPWPEARPDIAIRAVVGGGRPLRNEGVVLPYATLADRQVALPAATADSPALFADRTSGSAGYPRIIEVPLGEDLVAGTHYVELYSVSGRRLWVRFYVTNHDPETPPERVLQWNFRDMP